MSRAKLSSKSQIVLPASIRRQLNINPGDKLEITAENNVIMIRKSPQSALDALDSCSSDSWHNYAEELDNERDQWKA
ncbi:MAG: AbrB/MazE/SpoVT family DNA-binding domain-containing protein [Desulfuromusa sp.]|nr:AbrB/MazE/SpoVT family DNA-binding domain-containing protein [Desulfuromusa sp.]